MHSVIELVPHPNPDGTVTLRVVVRGPMERLRRLLRRFK